jgi:hypothetical protein
MSRASEGASRLEAKTTAAATDGAMAEDKREDTQTSGTGVEPRLVRNGGLSYLEIPAVDTRGSAAFYENVLGWNLRS